MFTLTGNQLFQATTRAKMVMQRTSMPILECALLTLKNNQLKITATDLDRELTATIDADNDGEHFEIPVDFKMLHKIATFVKDAPLVTVTFDFADKLFTIRGKGSRQYKITADLPGEDFPLMNAPGSPIYTVGLENSDWRAALGDVMEEQSQEDTRFYLNGVFFDGKTTLVATDGHRMAIREIVPVFQTGDTQAIIHRDTIKVVYALAKSKGYIDLDIAADKAVFSPHGKAWTLTAKIIDGSFPDWRRIMPKKPDVKVLLVRDELIDFADAAMKLDPDKNVHVKINGDFTLHNVHISETFDGAPITPGADIETGINPKYIKSAMRGDLGAETELAFADKGKSPIVITFADRPELQRLVMPCRV